MAVPKLCERCKKSAWTKTLNHMGDIYFYCKKCYIKVQYPVRVGN